MNRRGILTVKVHSGRLTRDTEWFGQMDPYCIIKVGDQQQRTNTANSAGKFPTWTTDFKFPVSSETEVIIECWDEDSLKKDDLVGVGKVPLSQVVSVGKFSEWIPIYYKNKTSGKLNVEMQFEANQSAGYNAPGISAHLTNPATYFTPIVQGLAPQRAPPYTHAPSGIPPPPKPGQYSQYPQQYPQQYSQQYPQQYPQQYSQQYPQQYPQQPSQQYAPQTVPPPVTANRGPIPPPPTQHYRQSMQPPQYPQQSSTIPPPPSVYTGTQPLPAYQPSYVQAPSQTDQRLPPSSWLSYAPPPEYPPPPPTSYQPPGSGFDNQGNA